MAEGSTPHPMVLPWRRRVPSLAAAGYVATRVVVADGGREPRGWVVALLSLVVAWVASRRGARLERAVGWGLAITVASLGARAPSRGLEACGAVGAMVAALGASLAVTRIAWAGGVVKAVPLSPRPAASVLVAVWWAALVAAAVPGRAAVDWLTDHERAWSLAAALTSTLVLVAMTEWTRLRRRLEAGVVERTLAMRALLGSSSAVALVVAVAGGAPSEAVARLLVAGASALLTLAALARDPVRVARLSRRVVVLVVAGGGVALLGAVAASGGGEDAWNATLVACAAALGIGAAVPLLEGPFRPSHGLWLDAFARARDAAAKGDPEDAVLGVLLALRAPCGACASWPELWTFEPTRVSRVDAAGYLHEREADIPASLVFVAAGEPEATLRAEVLEDLEVRRPELRPIVRWMNERGALLATVVASEGEIEGVLALPRVARDLPPTLEEMRAFKEVADGLAAACRARAAHKRMLGRAHAATLRAEAAEAAVERLHHERIVDAGRDALATTRLARPATVGIYSAASRMALEALERRTGAGAPLVVVAPSGVDPVPYIARAHLAGVRREAPLVLVDSTSAREHDLSRWQDPEASPLALAGRGMLLLLDGASLPAHVQQLVARALAERRAPWERPTPLDVQLALTSVIDPGELLAQGRLDPTLALRLGDARQSPIALPRLEERPEDLRAILTDRLAREGLRVLGRPVGMDHVAYGRLANYPFPGEDAELASIVQRLVARRAARLRGGEPDARPVSKAHDERQRERKREEDGDAGYVIGAADVDALKLVLPPAGCQGPLSA